jgi:hypothetical protein
MRPLLIGLTIAVTTASCDLFTATARGINIRLIASPLVAPIGDTVTFTVAIAANEVKGVTISFGDSVNDQTTTGGIPNTSVTFKHVYADTGSFMSRAVVSDGVVGERVVTQEIIVIPRDTTQPPISQRIRNN